MEHDSTFERNLNASLNEKNADAKVSAIERDIAQLRRVANVDEIDTQHSLTDSFRLPPPAYWTAVADLHTVDKLGIGIRYADAAPAMLSASNSTSTAAVTNSNRHDPLGKADGDRRVALCASSDRSNASCTLGDAVVQPQREDDASIMHGESLPPSQTSSPLNNATLQRRQVESQARQTALYNIEAASTGSFADRNHHISAPISEAHSSCTPETVDNNYSRQVSSGVSQLNSPQPNPTNRNFIDGLFGCLRPVWNKLSWGREPRSPSKPAISRNNLDNKLGVSTRMHPGGSVSKGRGELNLHDFMVYAGTASQIANEDTRYPYVLTDGDGVRYTLCERPLEKDVPYDHAHGSEACSACIEDDWLIHFDELSELKFFAAGAQGAVFRGEYRGETIAFKKVRDAADAENMRFLRALSHPNVIEVLGVVLDREPPDSRVPPCYGIVMAFCEFGSLYNLLHDGRPVQPVTCLRWLVQIADGMNFLHAHRIIHRDLKSPNVLIAADETVKISDFGASRTWSAASTKLTFAGTAAWVAPEVIRNEKSTDRVDVWSYGIVVWEVLTGEVPYRDLDQPAIIYGVGSRQLSLPVPAEGFPNGFRMLITTCWNDVPRARPSFRQIAERLVVVGHELANLTVEQFDASKTRWRAEIKRELAARYARNGNDRASTDRKIERELIEKREAELLHATELKQLYIAKLKRSSRLHDELCQLVDDHELELSRLRQLQAHYRVSTSAALAPPHCRSNSMRRPRAGSARKPSNEVVSADSSVNDFAKAIANDSSFRKRVGSANVSSRVAGVANSQSCVSLKSSSPTPESQPQEAAGNNVDQQSPPAVVSSGTEGCLSCSTGPGGQCVMCTMAQLINSLNTSARAADANSPDSAIIRKLTELVAMPHAHGHVNANTSATVMTHTKSAMNITEASNRSVGVADHRAQSMSSVNTLQVHATESTTGNSSSAEGPSTPCISASVQSFDTASVGALSNVTLTTLQATASSQNDLNASGVSLTTQQMGSVVHLRRSNRRVIVSEDTRSGNTVVLCDTNAALSQTTSSNDVSLDSSVRPKDAEDANDTRVVHSRGSVYGRQDTSMCDSRISCGTNSELEDDFRRDSRYSNAHADVEDNADELDHDGGLSDDDTGADVSELDSISFDEVNDAEVGDSQNDDLPNAEADEMEQVSCECEQECECVNNESNMGRGSLRMSGRSCASVVTVVHVSSASNSQSADSSSSKAIDRQPKTGNFSRQSSSNKSGRNNATGKSTRAAVPHSLTLNDANAELQRRVPPSTSRDSAIVLGLTPSTPTPVTGAPATGFEQARLSDGVALSHSHSMPDPQHSLDAQTASMVLSVIDEMRSSTASVSMSASNDSRPVSAMSDSSSSVSVSGRIGQADRVQRELERQISDSLSDKEFVVQSLRNRLREHRDQSRHANAEYNLPFSPPIPEGSTFTNSSLPARNPIEFAMGKPKPTLSSCSSEAMSSSDECDQFGNSLSRHALPVTNSETFV